MKSVSTMIVDAIITSFCVAGGFCLAELIGVPESLMPLFLLPAAILISKLGYYKTSWIKALLFLLLFSALLLTSDRILDESRFEEFDILLTLFILSIFAPLLSRVYDSIAMSNPTRHNKAE